MKIVFFGTPEFSIPSLDILQNNNYDIAAVVTAQDKPRGRGQHVDYSPVKHRALELGLRVLQPGNLAEVSFISELKHIAPDIMVVVAYRILPPEVFTIPGKGAFNLHASLLPKYRGAAPINWAIINGEKETGVTTFFLEEKVDTGNIILQARSPIDENETAGELYGKLMEIGADVVFHTVRLIEEGKASTHPQDDRISSPAPKLTKETGRINWQTSARIVHNLIRGLSPVPAAYTFLGDNMLKVYRSAIVNESGSEPPGTIVRADDRLHVAAGGGGIVSILELQREGKKRMNAEEFLRGTKLKTGQILTMQKI
jgi:methionyl-tRNA formyltransferase